MGRMEQRAGLPMLEAKDSFKNVDCNIHVNTLSPDTDQMATLKSKTRVQRCECPDTNQQPADDDLQDMGMSPMHGDGFEQVLSDDDGLACVPRPKAVRELDVFDVNSPACNRVETVPFSSCVLRGDWKWLSSTLPCMQHFLP